MKAFLYALRALIRKEAIATLREKTSRMILIVPLFAYIVLFGYIATFNVDHVPYALCDMAKSSESAQIVRRLEGSGKFDRVATLSNTAQISPEIDRGEALVVIAISPAFSKTPMPENVALFIDGRNSTTAQVAAGYVATIVSHALKSPETQGEGVTTRLLYNPNALTQWFIMPGLIAMLTMLQVLVLSALSVAREREQETFEQLLVTPFTTGQLLLAKSLVPILIGLFQGTLIFLVDLFWFEIPWAGSLLALYTTLVIFMMALVGVGLTISAYSKTMQQALLLVFIYMVPMVLLSGLFTPVENMPGWIQGLTMLDPLRFALVAVKRIYLTGMPLMEAVSVMWPVMVLALITLLSAYHFFKARQ